MLKKAASKDTGLQLYLYIFLAAIALFILYFVKLGSYPLADVDEPVYGQVAKEMAAGEGWLTPHYNGKMWFDKPPMFYWLSGSSVSVLGNKELSPRLPSAIFAVGLVLLVYLLASHDFGKRVGFFSSIVMATCLQQIILARAAVTDMTFVFFLTAALYGYRRLFDSVGIKRFGWALFLGVMTGLAMLTKGPVAPVLLGAAIIIHLIWCGKAKMLFSVEAACAVISMAAVGFPWYIAMYLLHRSAFVEGFLVANNITRFLKPEHVAATGGWYSYFINIPTLFLLFFPWSVFLPQAIANGWKINVGAKLAFVWFAVVFVFFSVSKTQLVTYIFPLYPAAAIFVGTFICQISSNSRGAGLSLKKGLWAASIVSLLVLIAIATITKKHYPEAYAASIVLVAILAIAQLGALIIASKGNNSKTAAYIICGGMVIFTFWLMVGVIPYVAPRISTKDFMAKIPLRSDIKYYSFSLEKPSILYYTNIMPRNLDAEPLEKILAGNDHVFVICKQKDAAQFKVPGAIEYENSAGLVAFTNSATVSLKGLAKK